MRYSFKVFIVCLSLFCVCTISVRSQVLTISANKSKIKEELSNRSKKAQQALSKIKTIKIISRPKWEDKGEEYILLWSDNRKKLVGLAKSGDLLAMEVYCRQELISVYTFNFSTGITNEIAKDVLPYLLSGAKDGNSNMRFMLACVLAGNMPIPEEDSDKSMETPNDYKYLDQIQSRELFVKFLNETNKYSDNLPFGLDPEGVVQLILQAFPKIKFNNNSSPQDIPRFGLG